MYLSKQLMYDLFIFLCFLSYIPVIFTMEAVSFQSGLIETISPKQKALHPDRIIDLKKTKKSLARDPNLVKKLMASSTLLTPDQRTLLLGQTGSVYALPLQDSSYQRELKQIITHPKVKCTPIITAIQPTPETLIVASAGNFASKTGDWCSNIIVYSNEVYRQQEFDYPMQCIQLHKTGTLLALAGQRKIILMDLEAWPNRDSIPFDIAFTNDDNRIIDMTFTSEDQKILVVNSNGYMQTVYITNKKLRLDHHQKQCDIQFHSIHFPLPNQGIAHLATIEKRTTTQFVGLFDILDIEKDNTDLIPYINIIPFKNRNKITLNCSNNDNGMATAHWIFNDNASDKARRSIKICRIERSNYASNSINVDKDIKLYRLIAPVASVTEQYNSPSIITDQGRVEPIKPHFLTVAFHGNTIAAINTFGIIHVWTLPEEPEYCGFQNRYYETIIAEEMEGTDQERPREQRGTPRNPTGQRSKSVTPPKGRPLSFSNSHPATTLLNSAPGTPHRITTPNKSPRKTTQKGIPQTPPPLKITSSDPTSSTLSTTPPSPRTSKPSSRKISPRENKKEEK